MLFTDISRKQAFLTHLGVSSCIFFILTYLIVFNWYPSYYMDLDGGNRGLLTIFFVDVILGPGLTLLVFKQGKKGLKFDMAIILVFQAMALTWGIKSVYYSKPGLTVFYDGRFACVAYEEVDPAVLLRLSEGQSGKPVLAFLRRPDTFSEYEEFQKEAYRAGSSEIYYYDDRIEAINDDSLNRIKSYQLNVENVINTDINLRDKKDQYMELWHQYIKDNPVIGNVKYYPLACRYNQVLAVFDIDSRKIIDYVEIYPRRAISDIKLKLSEERVKEIKLKLSEEKIKVNSVE